MSAGSIILRNRWVDGRADTSEIHQTSGFDSSQKTHRSPVGSSYCSGPDHFFFFHLLSAS